MHLTDTVLLTYLQHRAVVKVVGAGPPLQGREGHVASGERGDVAELIGAERLLLILPGADEAAVDFVVGALTGAAVVLVGHPGAVLLRALVDGKALGPAGVELEAHVRDVKGFSCAGEETCEKDSKLRNNGMSSTEFLSLEKHLPALSRRMSMSSNTRSISSSPVLYLQ